MDYSICPQLEQASVRRTLSRGSGGGRTIPLRLPRPPFSFVPSTARFLFGGTKRKCGVEIVGSARCHALLGKGRENIRPKYAKRVPALRLVLCCRSLRRGTFHRRKVPKDISALRAATSGGCAPKWQLRLLTLERCDAPQTPVASATQGAAAPWALGQTPRDGGLINTLPFTNKTWSHTDRRYQP